MLHGIELREFFSYGDDFFWQPCCLDTQLGCLYCCASKAVEILEAYEGMLEDDYPPDNECCEHGEMLLYKVDQLVYKEQEVSLLVKLGRLEEAEKLYQALLSMNPDNYRYYEGRQKCVGLHSETAQFSTDEIDQLEALNKSLGQQQNWSSAVKVQILTASQHALTFVFPTETSRV